MIDLLRKYITNDFDIILNGNKLTIIFDEIKEDSCIFSFEDNKSSDFLKVVNFLSNAEIELKGNSIDGNLAFIKIEIAYAGYPIPNVQFN